jgi:hypothetical protein
VRALAKLDGGLVCQRGRQTHAATPERVVSTQVYVFRATT